MRSTLNIYWKDWCWRTEAPILWPPDGKNWLIGKDSDAGKDWRQEETGTKEDEMVGRYHQLDGREFKQVPGVGDGQESLARCSPWSHKESDTTDWLNWIELNWWEIGCLVFADFLFFLRIWLFHSVLLLISKAIKFLSNNLDLGAKSDVKQIQTYW